MALQPYMPALQGSLGIRRPRNKYRNVAESYLSYCKKRKRRASRTRMLKLLEKLLCQRDGIHSEYGALLRYTQDYHKLLLHTDTVLQAYTLIECLEREVFNERYAVYLYIIDLCTELDGLGFLASDDGTYIITVDADDAVTDFPPFKHFLFLYKHLSDDGKTLLVILCISE